MPRISDLLPGTEPSPTSVAIEGTGIPGPTPTPQETLPPTATPAPLLVIVGEPGESLSSEMDRWSGERGWSEVRLAGASEIASLSQPPAAIISFGDREDGPLLEWAAAGVPLVAVGDPSLDPSDRIHVLHPSDPPPEQAVFMTGAAAGLATRTRWVGLLMEPGLSDREERLFLHGLRYVCPTCSLVTLEVGEASYSAYRSRGVDVVALVNFEGLEGSLPSLQGEGLWLIPLLGESDPPAGERVAAAVQQRTGQLLTGALEGLLAGEGGGPLRYTFGNRGLQVEVLDHGAITPGREQVLLEVAELLASGSLDPGADWIEGSEG